MSRIWSWVAALLIGLLVILSMLVVTANWKWLSDTAWGSVVINIISNFFFVIVLVMLFGFLYRGMLGRVRDFFGIDQQSSIQIYISTHEDITIDIQKNILNLVGAYPCGRPWWGRRKAVPLPKTLSEHLYKHQEGYNGGRIRGSRRVEKYFDKAIP